MEAALDITKQRSTIGKKKGEHMNILSKITLVPLQRACLLSGNITSKGVVQSHKLFQPLPVSSIDTDQPAGHPKGGALEEP